MAIYMRNRRCPCLRCRTRNMMGGAILITLGVLFLLENYGIFYFGQSWPVLLIVIGLLSFAAHSASTEGHIQPSWAAKWDRKWSKFHDTPESSQPQNDPRQTGTGPGPFGDAGR